jgi:hypothetical protein
MYTDKSKGAQSFCHWEGRMVSLHVEPKREMREEVTDPYYQVWHRATLRDGLVVTDTDGFIASITDLARKPYNPDKVSAAIGRLRGEADADKRLALMQLGTGKALDCLYHFSYYLQHTVVGDYLLNNKTLCGEIGLARRFSILAGMSSASDQTLSAYIKHALGSSAAATPSRPRKSEGTSLPRVKSYDDAKVALRRILEYRRKIYGCEEASGEPTSKLYKLYCLGRVLGNFNALSNSRFNRSAQTGTCLSGNIEAASMDIMTTPNAELAVSDTALYNTLKALMPAQRY